MATFALGLKDIKLKITKVNGIAYSGGAFSAASGTSIGEVMEGSTQIVDETPNEIKFKGDYSDATLKALLQRGDFTVETDIIDVRVNLQTLQAVLLYRRTKTVTNPYYC